MNQKNKMMKRQTTTRSLISLGLVLLSTTAYAEITLDGTLGSSGAIAGPNYAIDETVGQIQGGNLFHSFSVFNVGTGETATFSGPGSITNIISRVTGGGLSTIDGTLRSTIGGANFYLVNPSGVVFGVDASLDISGSFHVSTADYVSLGGGGRYDATTPANSVLTTAAPTAFGFLSDTPASISFQGSKLSVATGKDISVIGGDITIADGILRAEDGQITVVSVASSGVLDLTDITYSVAGFTALGTIDISHSGNLFSRLVPGGGFNIKANLHASGDNGGTIVIRGGKFYGDNAYVFADTIAAGSGGSINMQIQDEIHLQNESTITTDTKGFGQGGDITITTTQLNMSSGSVIGARTHGGSNAGNISINASESILIEDASDNEAHLQGEILSSISIGTYGTGDAGTATIATRDMTLKKGGNITASSQGDGNAGNINLTSTGITLIDGTHDTLTIPGTSEHSPSGIFGNTFNEGDGGTVAINANQLTLSNAGKIQAATVGATAGTQNSSNIEITVNNLSISGDASQISTQSESAGNAGNIQITATDSVTIASPDTSTPGGIYSTATDSGDGGDISVTGRQIVLTGGTVNVSASGSGDAGNITLTATEAFEMDGSTISTTATSSDGGNIKINAQKLVYLDNSSITSAVGTGLGNGGNINIDPEFVILNSSRILANAFGGNGGNITIVTDHYIASSDSVLNASSQLGIDGEINIESPDVDMDSGITDLPDGFLNAAALLRQKCGAGNMANRSSFLVSGRSSIPIAPDTLMPVTSPVSYSISSIGATDIGTAYYTAMKNNFAVPVQAGVCVAEVQTL